MDPEQKKEEQEKLQQARKSPIIFKFDEHQTYLQQHQRKDSASSEVAALLCISGRTSRISSVGSQGSAVSRLSALSGISRSPSPHRMILETSFCGPKPLENIVDGSIVSSVEPPTAEALEQVLLSRKHDPTQAVFAEGIKIEGSPKKKLTNGETKRKPMTDKPPDVRISTPSRTTGNRKGGTGSGISKRDPGKHVIGVTPSGTEYIRIKLKPDHMYDDKGLAPNERLVDSGGGSGQPHKKPVSLSLGRDITSSEQRLTPSSSPKPARHAALIREVGGSRSPSPATVAISRKSSFCSLFKTKDSPDSPRDRSRSRSKSRDRSTPQSQSGTPNKQKSVLAIFKPKRSGSKSKCSSPIDQDSMLQFDGISQVEFKFKSDPPVSEPRSRPSSRLRYYDTSLDGKSIHIPLHTPPEEKEDRKFPPNRETKESEPPPPIISPTDTLQTTVIEQAPALPIKSPKPKQLEKMQKIENLDSIHSLAKARNERERTWSLEVQRHSSQDSQETVSMDNAVSTTGRRISKPNLSEVIENPLLENGFPPSLNQHPSVHQQSVTGPLQYTGPTSTEKRRLLFATRIGSGSEEQIFSTQFSLSKTESLSSQLSEQTSIPDSPALDGRESLHRSDTIIRRPDDCSVGHGTVTTTITTTQSTTANKPEDPPNEDIRASKPTVVGVIQKKDSFEETKRKSKSTSEDEDKRPVVVMMRKKDSSEDSKRKSKSSEDDDSTNRHSRYIENFDIKKKFHETKSSRNNSSDSSIKERDSRTSSREDQDSTTPIAMPQLDGTKMLSRNQKEPQLPLPPNERQSVISTTDDLNESSESERDSERDPSRVKRHLTRHIGVIEDNESTGLVSQDSFEDELPYIPTTLPEERAQGVALIPMKERLNMELKTCPVDRPRSTTPMNPACLEEYCGIVTPDDNDNVPIRGEKLRISLPRKDSTKDRQQKAKSPRRISNASGKSWFEFAEHGIRSTSSTTITTPTQASGLERRDSMQDDEPPPPLPPRKSSGSSSGQWINFENIPEKRKPPKRITALPKDSPQDQSAKNGLASSVQYNYVKPEECQCECHEVERESTTHKSIASVDLLQQGDDMQPLLEPESQEGIDPSDSSLDYSYGTEVPDTMEQKPFEMDLSLGQQESNRSSLHSQDPDSPESTLNVHETTGARLRQKKLPEYRNP